MTNVPLKVSVACHDAGGAEMVSSWIRRQRSTGLAFSAFVSGPAEEIFTRKVPDVPQMSIIPILQEADLLVCGTGSTGWELAVWSGAAAIGMRTVAFIDHWKNYGERFQLQSGFALPGSIWVTDKYAYSIAERELPGAHIILKGNPYLDDIGDEVRRIKTYESKEKQHILIVYDRGEDICVMPRDKWPIGTFKVRNRPHPADMSSERSLAEDIAWADIVIGWDSMALVAAYTCGCETYSVLPPEERHIPVAIEYLPGARIEA